jgi:energy-coupling factor transporter ATP-binding protein EcfA2
LETSTTRSHHADTSDHAVIGAQVVGDNYGNIYVSGRFTLDNAELVRRYLEHMVHRCGVMPLQGIHEQRAIGDELQLSLDQVYTQLATTNSRVVTEEIATNKRLVLLGEPGSGKSTILRYLAFTLARAGLEKEFDIAKHLDGWQALGRRGRLLPILIPLLPFAKYLAEDRSQVGNAAALWAYIASYLNTDGRFPELATVVREELMKTEKEAKRLHSNINALIKPAEKAAQNIRDERDKTLYKELAFFEPYLENEFIEDISKELSLLNPDSIRDVTKAVTEKSTSLDPQFTEDITEVLVRLKSKSKKKDTDILLEAPSISIVIEKFIHTRLQSKTEFSKAQFARAVAEELAHLNPKLQEDDTLYSRFIESITEELAHLNPKYQKDIDIHLKDQFIKALNARVAVTLQKLKRKRTSQIREISKHLDEEYARKIEIADLEVARLQRQKPQISRVLLLLDGLDEVAGTDSRQRVMQSVWDFAQEYSQCHMVVTCRVRAYVGKQNQAWTLPNWPTTTLADWTSNEIKHFITAWYTAAGVANKMSPARCSQRSAALSRAISTRPDLQRLSVRPLLLTIIALVHLNDGRLPEDRVSFYSRCLDILLGQWEISGRDQTVYGTLMEYIGLPDRDIRSLRPLLTRVAITAHKASSHDSLGSIGRRKLRPMVADELESMNHPDPYRGAIKFLEYTDVRAGLLQASNSGDSYVFPHQTFQEYLAGLDLVRGVDFVQRIMAIRHDDRWRVPIMLGIGHLVSEGALAMPHQLLTELLFADGRTPEQVEKDVLMVEEIAQDVGWDRLERGGTTFKKLHNDLIKALPQVVEGQGISAMERVQVGVRLCTLGDSRPGVCDFPPVMASIKGIVNFEIGRYLVTNAQYALFMAEDGYNPSQAWWSEMGRTWLTRDDKELVTLLAPHQRRERKDQPKYWDDPRLGKLRPNHPVVGISWYEAHAFCCWLTHHPKYNPRGCVFRLPHVSEWLFTAVGSTQRLYPWGDAKPNAELGNFDGLYNGTTAVGCFAPGATPEGVFDLLGNAWEWTEHDNDPSSYYIYGWGWTVKSDIMAVNTHLPLVADYIHPELVGFRLVQMPKKPF